MAGGGLLALVVMAAVGMSLEEEEGGGDEDDKTWPLEETHVWSCGFELLDALVLMLEQDFEPTTTQTKTPSVYCMCWLLNELY